jgi:ribosomal protein S18 acetylase RimI-like enzyme
VTIRAATPADLDLLLELAARWRLESELPPPPYPEDPPDARRPKLEQMVRDGIVLIAEDGDEPVGYLLAEYGQRGPTTLYVTNVWVESSRRRRGLGRELLRRTAEVAAERGATHLLLDVDSKNVEALSFYYRLGFEDQAKILRAPLGTLTSPPEEAESRGAVHVQTDDADAVERAIAQYLPRISRSVEATVERDRTWTSVRLSSYDPDVARRLARELSERFGVTLQLALEREAVVRFVLHDRGRMVDEYLSVPTYYGALPPGDALALRANPTVVARLTGADPGRVRAAAPTGTSPAELPPARELYDALADVLGVTP